MPNRIDLGAMNRSLIEMTPSELFAHIRSNNLYYASSCLIKALIAWCLISTVPRLLMSMNFGALESEARGSSAAWINSWYGGGLPKDCFLTRVKRFVTHLQKDSNTGRARQTGSAQRATSTQAQSGTESGSGPNDDGPAPNERNVHASGSKRSAAGDGIGEDEDEESRTERDDEHSEVNDSEADCDGPNGIDDRKKLKLYVNNSG